MNQASMFDSEWQNARPNFPLNKYSLTDLVKVVFLHAARADAHLGCTTKTHGRSGRKISLEETYEAIEKLKLTLDPVLCREVGDVLLQVIYHGNGGKKREEKVLY